VCCGLLTTYSQAKGNHVNIRESIPGVKQSGNTNTVEDAGATLSKGYLFLLTAGVTMEVTLSET